MTKKKETIVEEVVEVVEVPVEVEEEILDFEEIFTSLSEEDTIEEVEVNE